MNRFKMIISYDGTRFFGWQKTKTGLNIQEELERAIFQITKQKTEIEAASRTDRGVHAKGQVVSFLMDLSQNPLQFRHSLNAVLCPDIRIEEVFLVDLDFHPTLHAHGKEYHYSIFNGPVQMPMDRLYSWHVPQILDLDLMQRASKDLIGKHDFSSFTSEPTENNVRRIEKIEIKSSSNRFCIQMRADRFLYKMARSIVGTLVYVGMGKLSSDSIPMILKEKKRAFAGICAPAHGLTLMKVFYQSKIDSYDHTK
jgi:tRNA pseudouridine38-40 synthase